MANRALVDGSPKCFTNECVGREADSQAAGRIARRGLDSRIQPPRHHSPPALCDGQRARLLSLLVITAIKANPATIQACFCFGLYLLKAWRVSPFSPLHKRDIF